MVPTPPTPVGSDREAPVCPHLGATVPHYCPLSTETEPVNRSAGVSVSAGRREFRQVGGRWGNTRLRYALLWHQRPHDVSHFWTEMRPEKNACFTDLFGGLGGVYGGPRGGGGSGGQEWGCSSPGLERGTRDWVACATFDTLRAGTPGSTGPGGRGSCCLQGGTCDGLARSLLRSPPPHASGRGAGFDRVSHVPGQSRRPDRRSSQLHTVMQRIAGQCGRKVPGRQGPGRGAGGPGDHCWPNGHLLV